MQDNIFWAKDYRTYLKSRFRQMKSSKRTFSIASLAMKCGCSQSLIKKIFAHKIHVGVRQAEVLASSLKLDDDEAQYLYFLAIYYSVKTEGIKNYLRFVIASLNDRGRRGIRIDDIETLRSFEQEEQSANYFTELALELSRVLRRPANLKDMEEYLLPQVQVGADFETACTAALDILKKTQPANEMPVYEPHVGNLSPFSLNSMKLIENSIMKLREHHSRFQDGMTPFTTFSTITAVSEENAEEIMTIIRNAREKIFEIAQSKDQPTRLLSVHLHAYSLTRRLKE